MRSSSITTVDFEPTQAQPPHYVIISIAAPAWDTGDVRSASIVDFLHNLPIAGAHELSKVCSCGRYCRRLPSGERQRCPGSSVAVIADTRTDTKFAKLHAMLTSAVGMPLGRQLRGHL